jgi:HlyD family type I secretion membrane fusion protein
VGVGLIALLAVGFGSWASLAPLASGVIASGVVIAEGERSVLRHLDGGIVKEIRVTEGQTVTAGQVLVRLEEARTHARLEALQAEYEDDLARYTRLRAEQADARTIAFPPELTQRDGPRVREIMQGEIAYFNERRADLEAELDITLKRRGLYDRHIAGVEARMTAETSQLAIIEEELSGLEQLFKDGYVSHTRILRLKRERAGLEGSLGEGRSSIAQGQIKRIEADAEAVKIQTAFRMQVMAEFREVQAKLFHLEEKIREEADKLARLDIRAPKAGAVLDLRVHAEGAVLLPGDPVLDIVPTGETVVIEAKIRPTDVDNVLVGAEAEVRFPAFRQRTTPAVLGRVIMVAADTLIDGATKQAFYPARIVLHEAERERLGDRSLVPGMPAEVTIRAGERTFIEYLLEPLTDVLARSFKE